MKLNMSMPATLALVAALALPSFAMAAPVPQASGNAQAVATLQVGGGVIMVSQGGSPFTSGTSNQSLFSGERLMVSDNSSATVVYNDGCRQSYTKPGVYTISASCKAGMVTDVRSPNAGTLTSRPIGVWVGAAVVTGALVARVTSKDRINCPPVSH